VLGDLCFLALSRRRDRPLPGELLFDRRRRPPRSDERDLEDRAGEPEGDLGGEYRGGSRLLGDRKTPLGESPALGDLSAFPFSFCNFSHAFRAMRLCSEKERDRSRDRSLTLLRFFRSCALS